MTVTIYDYANKSVKIELPVDTAEEINSIIVDVISGDETGLFNLKDGRTQHFDACPNGRLVGFYDGSYLVEGTDEIEKWLNFQPCCGRTFSYQRQEEFEGADE